MQNQEAVIWNLAKTWERYGEPARPNLSEVAIVNQYIKPNSKVLLLGSTPEYRDILATKYCDVTIVDYSESNFLAMKSLMLNSPVSERFIQADWLQMQLEDQFDLIIGDHVINLLPISEWNAFLKKLQSMLNETGKLLQRVIVRPERYHNSLETIFADTEVLVGKQLFSKVFYDLIFSAINPKTQTILLKQLWEKVSEAHAQGLITSEQLTHFKNLSWENNSVSAFFTTKEYLLAILKDIFLNNHMIHGDLYYRDFTFFIVSRGTNQI